MYNVAAIHEFLFRLIYCLGLTKKIVLFCVIEQNLYIGHGMP